MSQRFYKYYQNTYLFAFLTCIAVLPMSDTIALRNILLVLMLVLLIIGNIYSSQIRARTLKVVKVVPLPLVLWMVYLCLFPLWAPMQAVAWENLFGQWGESIIAWIVGFGAFIVLYNRGPGLISIGIASSFSLIVHLVLSALALMGFFSENFYQKRTLGGLVDEIYAWGHGDFTWMNFHNPLADGFNGVEVMHGNLGYASSLAIIIFSSALFKAYKDNNRSSILTCMSAIVLCFLSLFIIRSRGAIIFGLIFLIIALVLNYHIYKNNQLIPNNSGSGKSNFVKLSLLFFLVFLVLGIFGYKSIKNDYRWHSMMDKVVAGVQINDPFETLCNGLSSADELSIRNSLKDESQEYVDDVIFGLRRQDGGRILLMRVGIDFVLENPFGFDGSRHSYKNLMIDKCGHIPSLKFAHTHQSWMDLSLAIGWIGVALFGSIFINFAIFSIKSFRNSKNIDLLVVLLITSIFWFTRGFFDSLFREHYLEMQALVVSYIYIKLVNIQSN